MSRRTTDERAVNAINNMVMRLTEEKVKVYSPYSDQRWAIPKIKFDELVRLLSKKIGMEIMLTFLVFTPRPKNAQENGFIGDLNLDALISVLEEEKILQLYTIVGEHSLLGRAVRNLMLTHKPQEQQTFHVRGPTNKQ